MKKTNAARLPPPPSFRDHSAEWSWESASLNAESVFSLSQRDADCHVGRCPPRNDRIIKSYALFLYSETYTMKKPTQPAYPTSVIPRSEATWESVFP